MLTQNVRGNFVSCLSVAPARHGDTKGAVCLKEFLWIIAGMLPEATFSTFILRNFRKLNWEEIEANLVWNCDLFTFPGAKEPDLNRSNILPLTCSVWLRWRGQPCSAPCLTFLNNFPHEDLRLVNKFCLCIQCWWPSGAFQVNPGLCFELPGFIPEIPLPFPTPAFISPQRTFALDRLFRQEVLLIY